MISKGLQPSVCLLFYVLVAHKVISGRVPGGICRDFILPFLGGGGRIASQIVIVASVC